MKLLSSLNIGLMFEKKMYKKTCPPDLSGQKWEMYTMPSVLISERGFIDPVFKLR
jgi:hypothetical protein